MDQSNSPPSCCSRTPESQGQSCDCRADNNLASEIRDTTGTLTSADTFDHFLARLGWKRESHRVDPGLYRLGNPTPDSPVFASANYTLSFDALRSALNGTDAWILVLDTKGINVWCAAGKGTFGTEELIRSIGYTGLAGIVRHRKIIVPQLGAPGISWPDVMRKSRFLVEYGPVRARDLPEYLKTHQATLEMRRVEFPIKDRVVLTPVEFTHVALPMIIAAVVLLFLAGTAAALAAIAAVLAGTVLFPALLPVIPTHDFSTKGLILGAIVAIPFGVAFGTAPSLPAWAAVAGAATAFLLIPAAVAYLALNFTGCTTFTSRSGVKKEIFRYMPSLVFLAAAGVVLGVVLGISRLFGVI